MTNEFHIYALIDPRDGLVYYVGQTTRPDMRKISPLRGSKDDRNPKSKWVEELKAAGVMPVMEIVDSINGTLEDAISKEQQWILKHFESGSPLRNHRLIRTLPCEPVVWPPSINRSMLMTTIEAAEALGITNRRVRCLITDGVLDAKKPGRDWLVLVEAVKALAIHYHPIGYASK